MSVRPIETEFMGRRFRSRLEARWAIVFELMGLSWQYETEGFETPHGRYLPDFWIPAGPMGVASTFTPSAARTYGAWIEIKPVRPTDIEVSRLEAICSARDEAGFVLFGTFDRIEEITAICLPSEPFSRELGGSNELAFMDAMHLVRHLIVGHPDTAGDLSNQDIRARSGALALLAAMHARRARFEHGESPITRLKH